MSRREWRCRNPECGAVLGRLSRDGGVVLAASVNLVQAYFDTRKAVVVCPGCGTSRDFHGRSIIQSRVSPVDWSKQHE